MSLWCTISARRPGRRRALDSGRLYGWRGTSWRRRLPRWPALIALLLNLAACATFVQRAETAYVDGRYLEVAESLAEREDLLADLSPRERAGYGLYRGAALLELGDCAGARKWLLFAAQTERKRPGSLLPHQLRQLNDALADLQQQQPQG